MKNSHLIIFIVITLFFGTMFGLFIGALALNGQVGGVGSFASGWNAARNKLYETGYFENQMTSMTGKVKEVGNKEIIIETSLPNPLEDESLKTRKVLIGDNTELIFKKLKSKEEYEKDMAEGEAKQADINRRMTIAQNNLENCYSNDVEEVDCVSEREAVQSIRVEMTANGELGDRYKVAENFNLSDIAPGYTVNIQSKKIEKENTEDEGFMSDYEGRENIINKKVFEASRIEITEVAEDYDIEA